MIASLKAALAKKDGEMEPRQRSQPSSPPRPGPQGGKNKPSGRRQSMENVHKESKSASKPRRQTFDLHDLTSSPSWPPAECLGSSNGKEDDTESTSSDWVDKMMVNKGDSLSVDDNQVVNWQVDSSDQLSDMFDQKHTPNTAKVYPEQSLAKPTQIRKDSQSQTQDYESETATSDSLEADLNWQSPSLPRTNSLPSSIGMGSRIKKPQPRPAVKLQETRSMIPTPLLRKLPSPSSVNATRTGTGRVQVHADGKRRAGSGK